MYPPPLAVNCPPAIGRGHSARRAAYATHMQKWITTAILAILERVLKATKTLKALGDNGFRAVYISVQTARILLLIGETPPKKGLKIAPYWSSFQRKTGGSPLDGGFHPFFRA